MPVEFTGLGTPEWVIFSCRLILLVLVYKSKRFSMFGKEETRTAINKALQLLVAPQSDSFKLQVEDMAKNEEFISATKELRSKLSIPTEKGFHDIEDLADFLADIEDSTSIALSIHSFCKEWSVKLKLPKSAVPHLINFVLAGSNFINMQTVPLQIQKHLPNGSLTLPSYVGLKLNEKDGCVDLKIYPGASASDISKLLNRKGAWSWIQLYLATFDVNKKRTRMRKNQKRDEEVYRCYKKGYLDASGRITNTENVPKRIYDLDMDIRRVVIQRRRKLEH